MKYNHHSTFNELNLPIYAVDLEMVKLIDGSLAMAQVCIVNADADVLLNVTVRPQKRVVDYVHFITGLTPDKLRRGVELETARALVRQQLERAKVVVFHDPTNDIKALGFTPKASIYDTSKCRVLMELAFVKRQPNERVGLKVLAKNLLGEEMHARGQPHCPVEDAKVTMYLFRLGHPQFFTHYCKVHHFAACLCNVHVLTPRCQFYTPTPLPLA